MAVRAVYDVAQTRRARTATLGMLLTSPRLVSGLSHAAATGVTSRWRGRRERRHQVH